MADNNTLAHHGVLGQKWGVRKRRMPSNVTVTGGKHLKPGTSVTVGLPKDMKIDPNKKYNVHVTKGDKIDLIREGAGRRPVSQPKSTKKLSDNQLQDRIRRLELEKKYTDLKSGPATKSELAAQNEAMREYITHLELKQKYSAITRKPPTKGQKAARFVGDILAESGKTAAKKLATDALVYAGTQAINKKAGAPVIPVGGKKHGK